MAMMVSSNIGPAAERMQADKQFRGSGQVSAARAQRRRRFLHATFLSGSSIRLYNTMRVLIEPYQRTYPELPVSHTT